MLINDEEEKKKRLEEAMQITSQINSSNYQDNMSNNYNSDNEYANKLQEAMDITNSINPIENNNINDLDTTESSIGNIDLNNRPVVKNDDGSVSTVRSISIEEDGKEVLIPTVVNGKVVSDEEAIEHYHKTGEYLGKFNSVEEANAYAEQLHNEQEQLYTNNESNKKKVEILKSSKAFDDGYQFGDITHTLLGTATDVATNLGAGVGSVFENIVDIGAHAVATIQSLTGHEEASKKTRDWADKDVIKEGLKSDPYSSPIGAFYNFTKGNGTAWDNMYRQQLQKIKEKQSNGKELSSYEKSQLELFSKLYPDTDNKQPANYEDDSVLGDTSDKVVELLGYTGGLAAGTYLLGGAGNISVAVGNTTLNLPTLAVVGGAAGGLKEADSKGENVSEIERWSKAITGGLIEGTTEGLFGMLGVGGNELTDIWASKVANKMSTGAGKILAKLGVQATGEATEEFLSYAGNYIIDNALIDRLGDTDFSSKWDWSEVGEQMALAFVSSAISLGGESYINTNQSIKAAEEQLGRELTPQEKTSVIKAITEDALIKYDNKELFEDGEESVGNYIVASYDENGEVGEVVETLGKAIENPNEELNIAPVIIKDQQNQTFNVIDGETGMLLDTTPYTSVQEAVDGFTEIVTNMSEAQIESVNNNVADSTLALYAEIGKMIQERQSQNITSQNQQNNTIEQNNIQGQEINSQNNIIAQNGLSEQINNSEFYHNKTQYQVSNIAEIENALGKNKTYTLEEISDKWSDIMEDTYDLTLQDDKYVSLDENNGILEAVLYDGETDTAIDSIEIKQNKSGKYSSKEINNAIKQVSTIIDESRPIKGQVDIEGNEVRYMKKSKNINRERGNNNVRAEKIRNNNSQQEANRAEKRKNTRGEKEISRSNGSSQEKLFKSVQQFQREQQKQLGKDTKISLTEQNKLTKIEKTIQKEFENITGLNYGVYESNNGTEDAVYVNDDILVKHNQLQSKKKSNFLPFHELGHWFKVNRNAEWIAIHDIIDNTITKNQIEEYKSVLKDTSMFDNMSEAEIRDYIIEEIESDYFGNWANDISNWADMIRNKMLSDEYVQLLIDISDENISTHYNIFGTQEQQEQVYDKINEMMNNFIAENKSSDSSSNNNDLKNAIKNIKESKNVVNRNDIETIINNVDFYIKKGSVKIVDEKMEQRAGHNKNPNITKLNNIYPNITRKTLKTFLNNAFNKSMSLFRDSTVNIKDTNTNAQIKKSGLDENYNKNYDAKTDKVKANTADTLNKIIEEGIYGYTTIEENDKRRILYHNYFSVVNYDNKNELIRTIIKEYSTQKNLPNSFYYQKVESLDNLTKQIEDLVPPYPTNNSKDKVFEHKSSTNNSISQSNKNVKNSKNNAIKKSERIDTNNVTIDNQGRRLSKEQQEYFRDSKVRDENGNLIVVFHGTNNKFNKFNSSVNWFTDSKKYSEYYGREQNKIQKALNIEPKKSKYTYQAYLNIKNPKILGNIDGYLQEYNRSKEQFGFDVKHFLKESNIPYNDFKNIVDTYNTGKNEYEQAYRIYDITNSKEFRDYLISKGYDGMIANEKGNTSYAVFNSNQIKNVDNKKPTDNPDIRYSNRADMDSEGRELSREQQEFFKDSKVRDENGKLKVVYHGTDADFTVFDYRNLGKNGTSNGKGFYFTDQQEVASQYSDGSNIIKAYVNIQKPLRNTRSAISQEQYIKLAEAINDKTNGLYFTDMGDGTPVKKGSVEYNRIIDDLKHDYAFGGDDVDLITGILNSANLKLEEGYRVLRETLGYDGIIGEVPYRNSRGNWTSYNLYIAFTPEQIKNVDNKKPTNNPDIRYSNRYDTEENGEGGFYSQLEKVIEEKMPNTSNAQQIKGIIENSGIKQDEIKWVGLDDYLKKHSLEKISKQQLQDYIKANQINIETVNKSDAEYRRYENDKKIASNKYTEATANLSNYLSKIGKKNNINDIIEQDRIVHTFSTKYGINSFREGDSKELVIQTLNDVYSNISGKQNIHFKMSENESKELIRLADEYLETSNNYLNFDEKFQENYDIQDSPQYSNYKLEGGTNYQEILYTLPYDQDGNDVRNLQIANVNEYNSPHWQEENVLAHARTQDFEDTSGNKVLFIDEIQSDLHQEGRKKGYINNEKIKSLNNLRQQLSKGRDEEAKIMDEQRQISTQMYQFERENEYVVDKIYEKIVDKTDEEIYEMLPTELQQRVNAFNASSREIYLREEERKEWRKNPKYEKLYNQYYELENKYKDISNKNLEIQNQISEINTYGISDIFPFKKNWHEFVLRRMINNAVEQGYDEVAWTTGRQQRERYNLSKVIDEIRYIKNYANDDAEENNKPFEIEIEARKTNIDDFDTDEVVFTRAIAPDELENYIGKDLATKIINSKENEGTISNLNEEIRENGNSGMYLFYDQEIPSYLNKYLKKWNSKVEEITLMDADGKTESKQMGFKITDEMRNSIKQNGQPLFSNRQLDEEKASTYDERIQIKNRELIKELREQKENIQGLEGYSRTEIKDIVSNYIQDKLVENDLEDISINGAEIIGSRNRGNAKTDSDLDLVVEYSGDIREDDLFNILNEEPLEIEGIKVDINPITADNTGTLEEYLERSRQYDREVLNATKKETIRKEDPNVAPGATNAQGADRFIEQEIRKIEATGNWDNSIPVTKLTDIRETIEDFLGLGVKKGHFRERAYGIYKQGRDVIRGKELKDIDNILHETGHALDLGNRLKIDKESIADELLKAVKKHGGYENETRSVQLDEGFAEVIRTYSIIPEQAKIDYPQSVAVLEEIRKADKSFDDFIRKVQQQTYNYIHQNPQNRVHSNISVGESNRTPLTKAWLEQEVMRNVWDKDYAVKKVVSEIAKIGGKTTNQIKASNNAYYLTRLATGIHDKVTSMLSDGYINEKGEKIMPGLNKVGEILGDDAQRYNDLRDYLVARRDTDYKAKTLKTGIRDMDTKYVLEKFANDTQIKDAAQVVYDTLDGVMQYAVDNGLISEDDVKSLKESNAFYVPMQRVIEGKGNQLGRKGAVSDIIKARTGSELDIKDVLENIVSNSTNIIQQVENNNVLRALYNQGEEVGLTGSIYDVIPAPMMKVGTANLSMWENELKKQGVNTTNLDLEKTIDIFAPNNKVNIQERITSFINEDGKRVYLQFDKECVDLFNALMNLDGKTMSFFLRINARLNMPLRYGATMANIGFAIPNMISDTAQAAIFSNAGFIPVVDNALGVLDILTATNKHVRNFVKNYSPEYVNRIENMYNLYRQSGATSSTRMSQFRDSTQSNMKDIYGTKKSETLGIHEKWKPLKRLLDIMTYIPEISEQSTRFRVFEKNYDMYKSKGNSEMDARILAALESRDATQDFGRTGNLTREINQLIPFSAARVGSSYTFAEKVKANPKRTAMRIAILSAIALAIKAIGYDDKEIEELIQRKKDDNFVMKVGDKVVTIKKPQGLLRSIVNLTEYIQDLATGHIEDGKEGERLGQWIHNTLWDNLPADSIGSAFSSMPGGAILENWANKDFYYNTDIVKSYDLDLPDSQQYYEYNSQLAILLGKAFNYSPAKIDNLISGYFAGLGTQVTNIMDYASGKLGITAQKAEMGAESNAVGKRFIVNVNSNSASVDEIYNRKTELTKKKNGGTITSKEETELSNITAAVSNMSKVNKQIKEIKRDLTMSGKEKAEQIKELQRQRTDIARQALGKDLLDDTNSEKIETTSFYPTNSSLSLNKMTLELTPEMKEEYSKLASEFYKKYEKQGLYSQDKLKQIKTKAKDYAKKTLMKKYKSQLVKSK